jgi:hypothetical protein
MLSHRFHRFHRLWGGSKYKTDQFRPIVCVVTYLLHWQGLIPTWGPHSLHPSPLPPWQSGGVRYERILPLEGHPRPSSPTSRQRLYLSTATSFSPPQQQMTTQITITYMHLSCQCSGVQGCQYSSTFPLMAASHLNREHVIHACAHAFSLSIA